MKTYSVWGLFNYDTFWEVGRTRRDCREHATRIIGKDAESCFRDGSMRIAKVTVREGWKKSTHRVKRK